MSGLTPHFQDSAALALEMAACVAVIYKFWPWRRHAAGGRAQMTAQGLRVVPGTDSNFRTRLVLCLFLSGAACAGLYGLLVRPFLPPAQPAAVAADPPPPPPRPKIARASTAREGEAVKIVCGGGKQCAVAETDADAVKLGTGQPPAGKVFYVKNGTTAIVTGYDPQATGSDTADVFILAGADANSITLPARSDPEKLGFIPGCWMHRIPAKDSVTVYQIQGTGAGRTP